MIKPLLLTLLIAAALPAPSLAAQSPDDPQRKAVAAMMDALGWPAHIQSSIDRGQAQRPAKEMAGTGFGPVALCIHQAYTPEAVHGAVEAAFLQSFPDPVMVNEMTSFLRRPVFQKAIGRVTRREQAGASAAGAPVPMSAEELAEVDAFRATPAGKAYFAAQGKLGAAQHTELKALATRIVGQCQRDEKAR